MLPDFPEPRRGIAGAALMVVSAAAVIVPGMSASAATGSPPGHPAAALSAPEASTPDVMLAEHQLIARQEKARFAAAEHQFHVRHVLHMERLAYLREQQQAAYIARHAAPVITTAESQPAQQPAQQPSGDSGSVNQSSAGGSFQACVIARESGGNSQVMNSSGHYGLYQFSASTWAAYGGSPADFGHASVAEQNQVFNNAIAAGGQSNWSLYDGC
jgi:hypothetical protein